jgi:hypothetical protein
MFKRALPLAATTTPFVLLHYATRYAQAQSLKSLYPSSPRWTRRLPRLPTVTLRIERHAMTRIARPHRSIPAVSALHSWKGF